MPPGFQRPESSSSTIPSRRTRIILRERRKPRSRRLPPLTWKVKGSRCLSRTFFSWDAPVLATVRSYFPLLWKGRRKEQKNLVAFPLTIYWQFDFLAHLDWQSWHLCAADVGNEKEATARKAKIRLHIVLVFSWLLLDSQTVIFPSILANWLVSHVLGANVKLWLQMNKSNSMFFLLVHTLFFWDGAEESPNR